MSSQSVRSSTQWYRAPACAAVVFFIALVPALTLWNHVASYKSKSLKVVLGQDLHGVPDAKRPVFAWRDVAQHKFQKEAAARVAWIVPVRPGLVRLTNQFVYSVLMDSPNPAIVRGRDGYLVERPYITSYCQRTLTELQPFMQERASRIKAVQDHFTRRGKSFVFIITPSKMAQMPDKFDSACQSSDPNHDAIVPAYVAHLRKAGVNVVDAVSTTTQLRKTGVTVFRKGGIHWTQATASHATNELIRAINASAGTALLPELALVTRRLKHSILEDQDIGTLLNLLSDPLDRGEKVTMTAQGPCGRGKLSMAFVGGSFTVQVIRALLETGCVGEGRFYFYLSARLMQVPPMWKSVIALPANTPLPSFDDSDVIVLEENEIWSAQSQHVNSFADLILGPRTNSQPTPLP